METMAQNTNGKVFHEIEPVWNEESRILLLGTMPSPASRKRGFFYMHPQNRFWKVLPAVFGESLQYPNNATPGEKAITERRNFLLRHNIALWDVLSSCDIKGAADNSIKNAVPNDFCPLFEKSKISHVFCTGKTAFDLWKKLCAAKYEDRYNLKSECLPSTSPANASYNLERLIAEYRRIIPFSQ